MAVRNNSATDATRFPVAGNPTENEVTICGWAQMAADRNAVSTFAMFEKVTTGPDPYVSIGTDANGTTVRCKSTQHATGFTLGSVTVDTPFFFAVSLSTAGVLAGAVRNYGVNALTTNTEAGTAASGTPSRITICNNVAQDFFDGRYWNVKVWSRTLSFSELLVESYYDAVKFPSGIFSHWRLQDVADLTDYSGAGNAAVSAGSPATEDTPVQLWRPRRKLFLPLGSLSAADATAAAGTATVSATGRSNAATAATAGAGAATVSAAGSSTAATAPTASPGVATTGSVGSASAATAPTAAAGVATTGAAGAATGASAAGASAGVASVSAVGSSTATAAPSASAGAAAVSGAGSATAQADPGIAAGAAIVSATSSGDAGSAPVPADGVATVAATASATGAGTADVAAGTATVGAAGSATSAADSSAAAGAASVSATGTGAAYTVPATAEGIATVAALALATAAGEPVAAIGAATVSATAAATAATTADPAVGLATVSAEGSAEDENSVFVPAAWTATVTAVASSIANADPNAAAGLAVVSALSGGDTILSPARPRVHGSPPVRRSIGYAIKYEDLPPPRVTVRVADEKVIEVKGPDWIVAKLVPPKSQASGFAQVLGRIASLPVAPVQVKAEIEQDDEDEEILYLLV